MVAFPKGSFATCDMLRFVFRMQRHSEYWKQQKDCKISFAKIQNGRRGGGGDGDDQHGCVCLRYRLDISFITTRTVQQ